MNLFKKSLLGIFVFTLIILFFSLSGNFVNAEVFNFSGPAGGGPYGPGSMMGTVTLNKTVYSPGETIVATAHVVECSNCITFDVWGFNAEDLDNPPPPEELLALSTNILSNEELVYRSVNFTAPSSSGNFGVIFTESFTQDGATVDHETIIPYTVTTSGQVPVLANPTATNIFSSSADLGATVSSLGLPAVLSARGTCITTQAGEIPVQSNCVPATLSQTPGPFSHTRTGLISGTTYYFNGYADNATGRGYSPRGSFTTSTVNVSLEKNEGQIKNTVAKLDPNPKGTAYLIANISNLPAGQSCKLKNVSDAGTTIYNYTLFNDGNNINLNPSNLIGNQNNFQIQCGTNPNNPPYTSNDHASQTITLNCASGSTLNGSEFETCLNRRL